MKKNIKVEDFETYKIDSIHAGNYCELEDKDCLLKEGEANEPGTVRLLRLYNNSERFTETIKVCSKCESYIANILVLKHP